MHYDLENFLSGKYTLLFLKKSAKMVAKLKMAVQIFYNETWQLRNTEQQFESEVLKLANNQVIGTSTLRHNTKRLQLDSLAAQIKVP